jgi:hypothetical protein
MEVALAAAVAASDELTAHTDAGVRSRFRAADLLFIGVRRGRITADYVLRLGTTVEPLFLTRRLRVLKTAAGAARAAAALVAAAGAIAFRAGLGSRTLGRGADTPPCHRGRTAAQSETSSIRQVVRRDRGMLMITANRSIVCESMATILSCERGMSAMSSTRRTR